VDELEGQLARETDPVLRDAALAELGEIHSRLYAYDPLPDCVDPSQALPVDELGHTETWNDVLRLQRDGIEPQAFSQIRARVFMIHGDHDPHPGAATRDLLQRYIPHLEYLELEQCGHEPWLERHAHERFALAITDWLEQR
jgi:pimeloyl-ACP methyl ester carboxylesterase